MPSPPVPRRAVRLRARIPAEQILDELLVEALGSCVLAAAAIGDALVEARRAALPSEPDDVIAFAWAHLVTAVAQSVGPKAATEFVVRLQRALEEERSRTLRGFAAVQAPPEWDEEDEGEEEAPTSHLRNVTGVLRVLLVDRDGLRRSVVARALVQAGATTFVAETLDEALGRAEELSGLHAVHCSLDAAGAALALRALLDRLPAFGVVVMADEPAPTRQTLRIVGVERHEVVGQYPATKEVVARILEVATAIHESRRG